MLQLVVRLLRLLDDRRLPEIGVQPPAVQVLALEALDHVEPAVAVEIGERVEAHEPVSAHRADVLGALRARELGELADDARDGQRVQRAREVEDDAAAVSRARCGSYRADFALDRLGANRDLGLGDPRARHRQHERRGVPEVLLEVDRLGVLGKVVDVLDPGIDVVQGAPEVLGVGPHRDLHHRDAIARSGLDLLHFAVRGDLLLDLAGDELLDLFRRSARPRRDRDRHPHRDQRVLALRHPQIPEGARDQRRQKEHPRHLGILGEVACRVVRVVDQLLVALVRHLRPLRNELDSVAVVQERRALHDEQLAREETALDRHLVPD